MDTFKFIDAYTLYLTLLKLQTVLLIISIYLIVTDINYFRLRFVATQYNYIKVLN